jgi:hypothetical protein
MLRQPAGSHLQYFLHRLAQVDFINNPCPAIVMLIQRDYMDAAPKSYVLSTAVLRSRHFFPAQVSFQH